MDSQTATVLIGAVSAGIVVAATSCFCALAYVGARWREAGEEWAPDEVGGVED